VWFLSERVIMTAKGALDKTPIRLTHKTARDGAHALPLHDDATGWRSSVARVAEFPRDFEPGVLVVSVGAPRIADPLELIAQTTVPIPTRLPQLIRGSPSTKTTRPFHVEDRLRAGHGHLVPADDVRRADIVMIRRRVMGSTDNALDQAAPAVPSDPDRWPADGRVAAEARQVLLRWRRRLVGGRLAVWP
jgi:hypothetical protein